MYVVGTCGEKVIQYIHTSWLTLLTLLASAALERELELELKPDPEPKFDAVFSPVTAVTSWGLRGLVGSVAVAVAVAVLVVRSCGEDELARCFEISNFGSRSSGLYAHAQAASSSRAGKRGDRKSIIARLISEWERKCISQTRRIERRRSIQIVGSKQYAIDSISSLHLFWALFSFFFFFKFKN